MSRHDCLIVGAGIGGVAAALLLSRAGHRVTVVERKPEPTEIGAGLQISPNGARVLQWLGLESKVQAVSSKPEMVDFRHWRRGSVIVNSVLGASAEEKFQAPYFHLLRSDLLALLVDAAAQDPKIDLLFDAQTIEIDANASSITVRIGSDILTADVLIGADGIHSQVREHLFGADAARFTGQVAWRLLIEGDRLPDRLRRPAANVWWGPQKHFVHYPVRGGKKVNCVCVVEQPDWAEESWVQPGALEALRHDFSEWHEDVLTLIDAADPSAIFKWGLFDRKPLARWGRQCVTLLGDACHPTLPFLAQGASMALEDAAVLAQCLGGEQEINWKLRKYEGLRQPRTAFVQKASRRNGSIYHAAGLKALIRNQVAPYAGNRLMDKIYGFNALV